MRGSVTKRELFCGKLQESELDASVRRMLEFAIYARSSGVSCQGIEVWNRGRDCSCWMIDEECDCEVGETREVRLALSSGPGYIDEGVERPGLPDTVPEGLDGRPWRRSIVNKLTVAHLILVNAPETFEIGRTLCRDYSREWVVKGDGRARDMRLDRVTHRFGSKESILYRYNATSKHRNPL